MNFTFLKLPLKNLWFILKEKYCFNIIHSSRDNWKLKGDKKKSLRDMYYSRYLPITRIHNTSSATSISRGVKTNSNCQVFRIIEISSYRDSTLHETNII